MNEKKTITISVTSLFLVIAIIVIIVMGYFMYNISNEKQNALEEVDNLNSELSTVKNAIDSLQNTIASTPENLTSENTISNHSTSTAQNSSNVTEAVENECKTVLQKYLDFTGAAEGAPCELLISLNLLTYEEFSNSSRLSDNYVKTPVNYSNFKNMMLNYVSENWFEERFSGYKNSDGFVSVFDGGATGISLTIKNMKLISNKNNFIEYEVTCIDTAVDGSQQNQKLTATFEKSNNGHYVVSNVDFNN